MARPKQGYYNEAGKRVPGATTICKDDATGLVIWSNNLGLEGIQYRSHIESLQEAGTLIHEGVETILDGKNPATVIAKCPNPEMEESVRKGLGAFSRWRDMLKPEVVMQEMPLVSEEYRFGGTPDALLLINSVNRLGDWKTGALRPEHLLQMGAYDRLIQEKLGITVEGADVIRFDRDTGTFTHMELDRTALDLGWAAFSMRRDLYETMKAVRKYTK